MKEDDNKLIMILSFLYHLYRQMFIVSNGDVYDDEEIYGDAIYEYPQDIEEDDDVYMGLDDERMEDVISGWEWEYRMF